MDQSDDLIVTDVSMPLLEALDRIYPERCADPKDSERDIWIKVGERRLVVFLHEQYKRQLG